MVVGEGEGEGTWYGGAARHGEASRRRAVDHAALTHPYPNPKPHPNPNPNPNLNPNPSPNPTRRATANPNPSPNPNPNPNPKQAGSALADRPRLAGGFLSVAYECG